MTPLLTAALLISGAAAEAPIAPAPVASYPVVEIKGRIAKVQVAPGSGMPLLLVDQEGATRRVILGSLRYLMQNGFNPKAGDEIAGKAYRHGDDYVAIVLTLPASGKTLRLRDESGRPMWRAAPNVPMNGDEDSARK